LGREERWGKIFFRVLAEMWFGVSSCWEKLVEWRVLAVARSLGDRTGGVGLLKVLKLILGQFLNAMAKLYQ
jgi:hypothetical protein